MEEKSTHNNHPCVKLHCGCPGGEDKGNGICCYQGEIFNFENGKWEEDKDHKCGCKDGEIRINKRCCKEGDTMCRCRAFNLSEAQCDCIVNHSTDDDEYEECKCRLEKEGGEIINGECCAPGEACWCEKDQIQINGTCCDSTDWPCACRARGMEPRTMKIYGMTEAVCCKKGESDATCRCRKEGGGESRTLSINGVTKEVCCNK